MANVLHSVFLSLTEDRDPRVRRHALDALRRYQSSGGVITKEAYDRCQYLLQNDEEEAVRLLSLVNVSAFALHSNAQLDLYTREEVFIAICDAANDAMPMVCRWLGYFHDVNQSLLLQTLHKSMRSNVVRKRMPASACGAFVHGLEDEYEQVRRAAIDSICKLALTSETFANEAVKSLLDMVNDENDTVRRRAIRALKAIGARHGLPMTSDRIRVCLGLLDDPDRSVRLATHAMLRYARFTTISEDIQGFITDLLAKLDHWPGDRLAACRMFGEIGRSHATDIALHRDQLLGYQRGLAPMEKSVTDLARPSLLDHLSHSLFRQYMLIRDTHADCMPSIQSLPDTPALPSFLRVARELACSFNDEVNEDPSRFEHHIADKMNLILPCLTQHDTMNRLKHTKALLSPFKQHKTLAMALHNEQHHISYDGLTQILHDLLHLLDRFYQNKPRMFNDRTSAQTSITTMLSHSYLLEYLYIGGGAEFHQFILTIRQIAHQWMIMLIYNDVSIVNRLQIIIDWLQQYPTCFTRDTKPILDLTTSNDKIELIESLFTTWTRQPIIPFNFSGLLHQASAVIVQPSRNYEKPASFLHQFPFTLSIKAEIYGLADCSDVVVLVRWPDQTLEVYWPALAHIRLLRRHCYALDTTLSLTTMTWSESHYIEIAIARCSKPNNEFNMDAILLASKSMNNLDRDTVRVQQ
ncbi:armadillo-type protein [Syncephalis plumigaleata]|nr:armadillo-type protein [Syncephalis plumigaleata]